MENIFIFFNLYLKSVSFVLTMLQVLLSLRYWKPGASNFLFAFKTKFTGAFYLSELEGLGEEMSEENFISQNIFLSLFESDSSGVTRY